MGETRFLCLSQDMLKLIDTFLALANYETPPTKEDVEGQNNISRYIMAFSNDAEKAALKYNEARKAAETAYEKEWRKGFAHISNPSPKIIIEHFGDWERFKAYEAKVLKACDKAFNKAYNESEFWITVDDFYDRLKQAAYRAE